MIYLRFSRVEQRYTRNRSHKERLFNKIPAGSSAVNKKGKTMFKFSDDGKTVSIDHDTRDRLAQRTDKQKSMDLVNEMLAIAGELNTEITKGLNIDPGKPSSIFERKCEAKRKREATINFLRVMPPPGGWFDPSVLDDIQNED